MANILFSLTLLAYYSASALFIAYFLAQRESFCRLGTRVLAVGLGFHTAALALVTSNLGRLPAATLGEALLVFPGPWSWRFSCCSGASPSGCWGPWRRPWRPSCCRRGSLSPWAKTPSRRC